MFPSFSLWQPQSQPQQEQQQPQTQQQNLDAALQSMRKPRRKRQSRPTDVNAPTAKRRYLTTTDDDRYIVINMFVNGKSDEEIEQTLRPRVSLSNVRRIIYTFQKENRIKKLHKGGSDPKYTDDEQQLVVDLQRQHNDWTYKHIRDEWKKITGSNKKLSVGTIHNIFRRYGITTKRLYVVPESRNNQQNIEERFKYARANIGRDSDKIIYVDEMGFNFHRVRGRGRNMVGQRATVERKDSRGGNISVCAAISPKYGLLLHRAIFGAFDSKDFAQFLIDLIRGLPKEASKESHWIVMDNVPMHKTDHVKCVFEGGRVLHIPTYLPPYSPQLNAIEECFSSVAYYVNMRRVDDKDALLALIDEAFKTITPSKCKAWHGHVVHWLQHCLDCKPLETRPDVDGRPENGEGDEMHIEQNDNNDENHV